MARPAKPYLRKQTRSWYCSIGGHQISLGKDREAAHAKFHALMADREQVKGELTTLYDLSQVYLDWVQANRSAATYDLHRTSSSSLLRASANGCDPPSSRSITS